MPAPPAKSRPAGRLLIVDGRLTFVPTTLKEVGRGTFPGGPPGLPSPLLSAEPEPHPRRGRPRKRIPARTWENDDLLASVTAIVGCSMPINLDSSVWVASPRCISQAITG